MSRSRSLFWSACLGNLFEHYDTALFGFLSPFLAHLIFPKEEPVTALILTYAMIPLGMLARPFGSLVFGYIGDIYGRGRALFLTLAGMSLISGSIALIPSFQQIGFFSPLLFCMGRIIQNFLAAGETMGGAIFLLENASPKKHDLLSGLYNASTIGGILFASAGVALFSSYGAIDPGWRVLYLFGCITALFGTLLRGQIHPAKFAQSPPSLVHSLKTVGKEVLWSNRKGLGLIAIISGFAYSTFAVSLVLMNGFIPLISKITKAEMMRINTLLLVFDFCALPLFGWLSSKVSREKMMIGAAFGVTLSGLPLFLLLESGTLTTAIGVRLCFVLFGVAFFAPFHAWAQQLIPPVHRYSIISFGYAIGSQLLGGPTAAISLWLFKKTGLIASISFYWIALSLISGVVLTKHLFNKKMKSFT